MDDLENESPEAVWKTLVATVDLFKTSYPGFLNRHRDIEVGLRSNKQTWSSASMKSFVRLLARALDEEADLVRKERNDAYMVPIEFRKFAILGAFESCSPAQQQLCDNAEEFRTSFFQELNRKSPQGVSTIISVPDGAAFINQVANELNREDGECTPKDQPICRGPYLGAVMLRITPPSGNLLMASASCRLRSLNDSFEGADALQTTVPSNTDEQVKAGVEFAIEVTRQCRVIALAGKRLLLDPESSPETRVSGWNAAYFAGAPFLLDAQAPTTSATIFSALDLLTFLGSVGSVLGAVYVHNEAPHSSRDDQSMKLGVGLLGANVVVKIGGGVCYSYIDGCGQVSSQ